MHRRALPRSRKTPTQSGTPSFVGPFSLRLIKSRQLGLVLLCLASVLVFNLVFAIWNSRIFWLVPVSLPFTALLGATLYFFSDYLWRLQVRVVAVAGRIQAAFLLFFLVLLTILILYFLLLAWPMGFLLKTFDEGSLVLEYRRWSLDLAAVQSMIIWAWSVCRRV